MLGFKDVKVLNIHKVCKYGRVVNMRRVSAYARF